MKTWHAVSALVLAATVTVALGQTRPEIKADPILFGGHGALFGRDGKEISVTPQFIREAQKYYIDTLYAQSPPDKRAEFDRKRLSVTSSVRLQSQDELFANSYLIEFLIKVANPRDGGRLASKNKLLRLFLRSQLPTINQPIKLQGAETYRAPEALLASLQREGLIEGRKTSVKDDRWAYIDGCSKAGVPIPPDWDWGWSGSWRSIGLLRNPFISSNLPHIEVFAYASTNPQGVCLALPRADSGTSDVVLLGVICLGKESSNACFWDNQKDDATFTVPRGKVLGLLDFAGGPELYGGEGDICTACHAGENPYILHPGTALGRPKLDGLHLFSDNWYLPLVSAEWPQNVEPTDLPFQAKRDASCFQCHYLGGSGGGFPKLSEHALNDYYCYSVLSLAIDRTMPPWKPGDADYAAHAKALLGACGIQK